MKSIHMPRVDPRYWLAITLASVFGTNLGDLYAHESGLGIGLGLLLLAALAAAVFLVERGNHWPTTLFYWIVIIVIRTGATNIADYLAFHVHIPGLALTIGLAVLLALLAWRQHDLHARRSSSEDKESLASTGTLYWTAMLTAGVFGTVLGDVCQHLAGQNVAAAGLSVLLALIFAVRGFGIGTVASYWAAIAVARTTGTALGDWIAENHPLALGLATATLVSGLAFLVAVAAQGRAGSIRGAEI